MGILLDSELERTERQGYSREAGLMELQPDRAWVTRAGKPWGGVQVVRYAADTSNEEKLQEWILLV